MSLTGLVLVLCTKQDVFINAQTAAGSSMLRKSWRHFINTPFVILIFDLIFALNMCFLAIFYESMGRYYFTAGDTSLNF